MPFAHPDRTTRLEFVGSKFIDRFLSPPPAGCRTHNEGKCLCDVDIKRTESMTWDQTSEELVNVETADDLVLAAANIWLNLDIAPTITDQKLDWLDDEPTVERVVEAVARRGANGTIERECHVSLDKHTFALMRRALDVSMPQVSRTELILSLHREGLKPPEIRAQAESRSGMPITISSIYHALRRNGLAPNRTPLAISRRSGRPQGWDPNSGLGYTEWREKYGET